MEEKHETQEYICHTSGFINVEAENPEEARDKAWDDMQRHHEVHAVDAIEPLDRDDNVFTLQLNHCGSNIASGGYEMWESKSAMWLAFRAVTAMSKDFVGDDHSGKFQYDLATTLLAHLKGDQIDKEKIWDRVQKLKEKKQEDMDNEREPRYIKEQYAIKGSEYDNQSSLDEYGDDEE